jgi:hypothetical protein
MSQINVNDILARTGTLVSILSNLNLQSVPTGTSVNNLGIDIDGNVIIGTTASGVEVFVTGGTYNDGVTTFTNNIGDTFDITGYYTGSTDVDVFVTGGTYNNGITTFTNNIGDTFDIIGYYTGSTDMFITGGTYDNGVATFTNNIGNTFDVAGFYTGSTDVGADIFITGGTYDNGTTTFTNNTGGTFDVIGYYTGSTNISDALYTVNNNLDANNTTTATTSVCIYGVNVFTGVTNTNYATKLPQPVTGKSVKIINNGLTTLAVYPSNIGGQVNNLPIDTPAQIPADGKLYEFICIVNPMPGIWTFSPPATAQYDSGEMSISISARTIDNYYNPVITAYDSTHVGNTRIFNSNNYGYNGRNKPSVKDGFGGDGAYYLSFRPETPWKGIAKIKVYTNLIDDEDNNAEVTVFGSGQADYYSPFDGSIVTNGQATSGSELFNFNLRNKIAGTAVPGSTIHTSANIGDDGTIWGEKVANTDSYSNVSFNNTYGSFIGNKTLGTVVFPFNNLSSYPDASGNQISQGDNVELFYSSYISFQIQPLGAVYNYGVIPDFKFRFVIEYYQ